MKKKIFVILGIILIIALFLTIVVAIKFHIPIKFGEAVRADGKRPPENEIMLAGISGWIRLLIHVDAFLNFIYAIYLKVKKKEKIIKPILFSLLLVFINYVYVLMFTVS